MLKSVSFANPASSIKSDSTTGILQITGPAAGTTRVMTVPDANFTAARTDAAQSFTGDQTLATGNIIQGTAAKGVNFTANTSAAGMTSRLLNWYEEGTWTPNTSYLTIVGTPSSSGTYTRIGRQVTIRGTVAGSTSVTVGATGILTTDLPYNSATGNPCVGVMVASTNSESGVIRVDGALVVAATTISPVSSITFTATYFV